LDQALTSADDPVSDVQMPVEALDMIKAAGINALVMTGEKILDGGLAAAQSTLDAITARRLRAIGLGEGKVTNFRINGLSISWLHASEMLSAASRKATSDDERASFMLPYHPDQLAEEVTALKRQSDIVIVSLNWQTLAGQTPTAAQRTIAHRMGQAGADMIVGMGGEQVQGLELYQLEEKGGERRDVLIAYSLGNTLTENRNKRELLSGALVHLTLTYDPRNKTLSYDSLSYSPSYVRNWTAQGKQRFQVLLSAETPPVDMPKTQQEQMARSLQLIREAFAASPAVLQR
jgi:poly-gamma-glutamate capsule biosynthesis protein CapA/YwtB (metallophosphatase superfamily)